MNGYTFTAILSSTILTEGTFSCETVPFPTNLAGVPHFVGHPATKGLLEILGAVQVPSKFFNGLDVGETYLAVPLANNQREAEYTVDQVITDVSQLTAKVVRRIA